MTKFMCTNATSEFYKMGQSLWLDNISRALLKDGTLQRYIREMSVTGLTSNPTIFEQAIQAGQDYDAAIAERYHDGKPLEDLFYELALQDIEVAAEMFGDTHDKTAGVDGWVSLEVSPKLAHDANGTLAQAKYLHELANRRNLMIKIPGTSEGLAAVEEAVFLGIPVNVTLLFSREQYIAAAEAYMRGIERRIEAGLLPVVGSVASVFVSRWDKAVQTKVPDDLHNKLGIAIAERTYQAYEELLSSPRWQRLANCGARAQRLLWASTSTKDPAASDTLYATSLAAPFTINTMPDATLLAVAERGAVSSLMRRDGGGCEDMLKRFAKAGIDYVALATQLQEEGAAAFVASWDSLLSNLQKKCGLLGKKSKPTLSDARSGAFGRMH